MTRQLMKTNIRVVIYPRREGDYGYVSISGVGTPKSNERHEITEADRIAAEVERHVDDYSQVSVEYDYETRCGTDSYSVNRDGNGLGEWPNCCVADQGEFYADHRAELDEWFFAHGMDDPDYLAEFRAGHHWKDGNA